MRAARLFERGWRKAQVARDVGVSAQSVGRWYAAWQAQGTDGLRKAGRAGRKPRLDADQLEQIEHALREGPQALGYDTPLWMAVRLADLIERQTRVRMIRITSIGSCSNWAGVANDRWVGRWNATNAPSVTGSASAGPPLKKALAEGRLNPVCIDESGLSQQPHRVRTGHPVAARRSCRIISTGRRSP